MKDWIKDNVVSIIFGVFGSIGLIGSIASQVQDMAASYPNAFWWWTAAAILLGAFVGVIASGLGKKNADARLSAVKEFEETKRQAKDAEESTEQARIQADKERDLERMRQEQADRTKEEARQEAERAERERLEKTLERIEDLPSSQKAVLSVALSSGNVYESSRNDKAAHALEESGLLIKLPIAHNYAAQWKIDDSIAKLIRKDKKLFNEMVDAKIAHDEEEKERQYRGYRSEFDELDFNNQLFLYALHKKGAKEECDWMFHDYRSNPFIRFVKTDTNMLEASISPKYAEFFREDEDNVFYGINRFLEKERERQQQ